MHQHVKSSNRLMRGLNKTPWLLPLSLIWLTGCVHAPVPPEPSQLIAAPSTLTAACYVTVSPTVEQLINAWQKYPKATSAWEARFLVMKDYADVQTDNIGNCNKQLETLRALYEKQSDLETKHDTGGGAD